MNNLKKHVWRPQRTPQNITTNCKKHFAFVKTKDDSSAKPEDPWENFMSLWNSLTYSKTPEIYEERLHIVKTFISIRPAVIEYLDTWILPEAKQFVVAWACQYPHLRNLNTSRVESGHAYVKTFIHNSKGDLLAVFKALAHAVDSQINHIHELIARDTVKTLVNIIEILESRDTLSPGDFHFQWHLKYNPEISEIEEPNIDLDEEIRNLTVALANEPPNKIADIFSQINSIVAGTHNAVPIQAPEGKIKTKEGQDTSAFELVEAKLKSDKRKRDLASNSSKQKSKRIKKTTGKNQNINAEKDFSSDHANTDLEESDDSYVEETNENSDSEPSRASLGGNNDNGGSNNDSGNDDKQESDIGDIEEGIQSVEPYAAQIPKHLVKFIAAIFDPAPDVRGELVKEIQENKDMYSKLQGNSDAVKKIISGITMKTQTTKAT
ncbi:hypothetical protein PTTG_28852 [Puccinia triticina 1-1 BBBD Race 1]|uniref:MULE transposase domain-containing protein n=1 Tax=Puccinia triticina (isolate 1-1 / race 1 (BBBD)) TaxID=630390 RepID=A0A180G8G3_PUCT1|nr:hypothetical protein PTTG_28852 [Puccinia triticina 1-1 BBBD Race 1]